MVAPGWRRFLRIPWMLLESCQAGVLGEDEEERHKFGQGKESTWRSPHRCGWWQEQWQRSGLPALTPAYEHHAGNDQAGRLLGFAVAVIKVDEMIATATADHLVPGLLFTLRDPAAPPEQQILLSQH